MKYKNKRQSGGDMNVDTDFIHCYESNLKKIQNAIRTYSGKHTINVDKAREFIENQTSQIRQQAAKHLVDNTIYITLQEVFDIVGNLITTLYSKIGDAETIYLYSGKPEKSFYFLSVIALYYIRQKGLKEPIFIKQLNSDLFTNAEQSPIIILDDVSYSGAQMSNMLNAIYNKYVVQQQMSPPNIYVALIALNENSKYKLSNIQLKSYEEIPSPFQLIYLEERCYKPLISILGIEHYFYVLLLFSPWTISDMTPYVSIYLDHKLADDNSTFTTTLLYGQIPPSSIDISTRYQYISEMISPYMSGVFDTTEKHRLISELDNAYKIDSNVNYSELLRHFMKEDNPIRQVSEITFSPFINGCNQDNRLLENIKDPQISQLDYFIFMVSKDCLSKNTKKCVVLNSHDDMFQYLIEKGLYDDDEEIFTENGEKVISIHDKITSIKCPESWYKKGEFAMTCTSSVGGRKTKRRNYKTSKRRNHKKTKRRN